MTEMKKRAEGFFCMKSHSNVGVLSVMLMYWRCAWSRLGPNENPTLLVLRVAIDVR